MTRPEVDLKPGGAAPRIALIHAVAAARDPVHAAFAAGWPSAELQDIFDLSLPGDLDAEGALTPGMIQRFLALGHYAAESSSHLHPTRGILFTCSAFGPAIEAVRADLSIPVLKPNEAAFERALALGARIGLLVTFAPALAPLKAELAGMATAAGMTIELVSGIASGGLEALQAGQADRHDALVVEAAAALPPCDVIVLGQFSMARAAPLVVGRTRLPVLTTPDSAVAKLKSLLK